MEEKPIVNIEDLDLDKRIFPNHPGKRIKFYTDKEISHMKVDDLKTACKE